MTRWRAALGVVLAVSGCVAVLGLDAYEDAIAKLCRCDEQLGFLGDCTTVLAARLDAVSPTTRTAWLQFFADSGCGDDCVNAYACYAQAGTCSTTLGEAGGYWLNLFNGAGAIGVEGACGGQRRSVFIGGGLPPSPVMATVKVGDRVMSVVMGAAQRGSTGAKSANVAFSPQKVRPPIRSARKRSYSYTVSD